MDYITEPEKRIPIKDTCDLCIVGGSCTGVFAAVRAARLGLSVVLVEGQGMLGGTAVGGLVNIWHSLCDVDEKEQIIAGLTDETIGRLSRRDALVRLPNRVSAYNFNPFALAVVLDEYVKENKIKVRLHTRYVALIRREDRVQSILIEDADGRGAISASFFIDATGDGRLAHHAGVPSYALPAPQPPTSCFLLGGETRDLRLGELIQAHGAEFGLDDDWGWSAGFAGIDGVTMRADNHVFGLRLDRAEDLTLAEIEGRRRADAFVAMLKKYGKGDYHMLGLCSHIGVRETLHYETLYRATARDLLCGTRYENPVMKGSYRIDVHHAEDNGITFQYLDGKAVSIYGKNTRRVEWNWREKEGLTGESAKYYELPFDVLVPQGLENLIPVGRMIHADEGAFGALRVMVNLNQLGEAAGVAAYLAVSEGKTTQSLDRSRITRILRDGGSAL